MENRFENLNDTELMTLKIALRDFYKSLDDDYDRGNGAVWWLKTLNSFNKACQDMMQEVETESVRRTAEHIEKQKRWRNKINDGERERASQTGNR